MLASVREFLTPQVWKQARQAGFRARRRPRWDLQLLVFVMVLGVWAGGDSLQEKFEAARGFYAATHAYRRRPGRTLSGFHKALARLPLPVLRAVATGVGQGIGTRFKDRLLVGGFLPLGCDGSRVECPRSEELQRRLPPSGKEHSAPSLWVTALVHLRLGILWQWRLGLGNASEQRHLLLMLPSLPAAALIVADAAFFGYELAWAVTQASRAFLLRSYSKSTFYRLDGAAIDDFVEGIVYCWPQEAQRHGRPPLRVRLLRVRGGKHDVWLATNVLDPKQLSHESAARFYRWRWGNEGLFRSYKRTLAKFKLQCRTLKLVHRELEGSLLAAQLLLAQAAWAIASHETPRCGRRGAGRSAREIDGDRHLATTRSATLEPSASAALPAAQPGHEPLLPSVRRALQEIRRELRIVGSQSGTRRRAFRDPLSQATCERRARTSAKEKRPWPRRKPHHAPAPPHLRTLPSELAALFHQHLSASL